ncbi:hypothetical protein [Caudoviricetes sp.]|nr:hypothetical protein [Caudoviricetes sp.]
MARNSGASSPKGSAPLCINLVTQRFLAHLQVIFCH